MKTSCGRCRRSTREIVDRIIALGLIDVRDIEEVGEGPLVEEVGVSEDVAERMVDVCTEEAKIVIKEQEAKKKTEAAQREASRNALLAGAPPMDNPLLAPPSDGDATAPAASFGDGTDGQAGPGLGEDSPTADGAGGRPLGVADERPGEEPATLNAVTAQADLPNYDTDDGDLMANRSASARETESGRAGNLDVDAGEGIDDADVSDVNEHQAGPMEHVEGMSPEIVTHDERLMGSQGDELSPEERAIHGPDGELMADDGDDPARKEFADEQSEEAALAEGRVPPPSPPKGL